MFPFCGLINYLLFGAYLVLFTGIQVIQHALLLDVLIRLLNYGMFRLELSCTLLTSTLLSELLIFLSEISLL